MWKKVFGVTMPLCVLDIVARTLISLYAVKYTHTGERNCLEIVKLMQREVSL